MGENTVNKVVSEANKHFSRLVLENYKEVTDVTFGESDFLVEGDLLSMQGFHSEKVYMIEADDESLFGIRANHFVVEEGTSENHYYEENGETVASPCILVSANHKGSRTQKLFVENKKIE